MSVNYKTIFQTKHIEIRELNSSGVRLLFAYDKCLGHYSKSCNVRKILSVNLYSLRSLDSKLEKEIIEKLVESRNLEVFKRIGA